MTADPEVELRLVGRGSRGARYEVRYCGEVLIASSRDPEFEACRVLLARGIRGRLATRWAGSSVIAMRVDIEAGANLTTIDGERGLNTVAYRPFGWSPADGLAPCSGTDQERAEEVEALGW